MPWGTWPKASKQIIVKWPNRYMALWCSRIRIPLGLKKMWITTLQCQPVKFWIIAISWQKNTSCIVVRLSNRLSLPFSFLYLCASCHLHMECCSSSSFSKPCFLSRPPCTLACTCLPVRWSVTGLSLSMFTQQFLSARPIWHLTLPGLGHLLLCEFFFPD